MHHLSTRGYSADLLEGGLEIPYILTIEGDPKLTAKAKKLIEFVLEPKKGEDQVSPPCKKRNTITTGTPSSNQDEVWVKIGGLVLLMAEKTIKGEQLDDRIIDAAQWLLKNQLPDILGLRSTLLQNKMNMFKK